MEDQNTVVAKETKYQRYYRRHREQILLRKKEYAQKHPDKVRDVKKTYHAKHPLRVVYDDMMKRCGHWKGASEKKLKSYFERGIEVCESWRGNFDEFEKWCFENGWKKGFAIDRIDNNKGYSPDNCRFVTHKENNRNCQHTIWVEYEGRKMSLGEAVEVSKCGLSYDLVYNRFALGKWPLERALFYPVLQTRKNCFVKP